MNSYGRGRIAFDLCRRCEQRFKTADAVRGIIPATVFTGGAIAIANAFGGLINVLSGNSNSQDALGALTNPDNARHQ